VSPLCRAALEADSRAFAALLHHVKSVDEAQRTVLMVQVENEPGQLGTDRDYSDAATRAFNQPVPKELLSFLEGHRQQLSAPMAAVWNRSPKSGNWTQVFGDLAPESFSAWLISNYVNTVAAAGKGEYPLPMYVNVWLIEGVERAGRWPSGGAHQQPWNGLLEWCRQRPLQSACLPSLPASGPDIYQRWHPGGISLLRNAGRCGQRFDEPLDFENTEVSPQQEPRHFRVRHKYPHPTPRADCVFHCPDQLLQLPVCPLTLW
jgi:hypothetical protein